MDLFNSDYVDRGLNVDMEPDHNKAIGQQFTIWLSAQH